MPLWTAAAPFVAELLSLWLQREDGERQACDGAELARNAVTHIRTSWPARPPWQR